MKKKALLVGINYVGTSNQLKGCLNDSQNMNEFLTSKGFTDIKLVLEKEATTDGIKAGLEWLVADTEPGDVIVFHYSGHGSQLPSSHEEDGFEEIICPIDLNWMDKVITDDTLREVFNKVPNGVNTTVILDCCHSGTMLDQTESLDLGTKDLVAPKTTKKKKGSRYMKPPAKIAKKLQDKELVNWSTAKDVNATALLVAGCHANQTSADAIIDGVPQGAATAAMLKSAKANSQISYRSLVTEMVAFMSTNRFTQIPELDGSPSLYDQTFLEPYSFSIPAEPAPAPAPTPVPSPAPAPSSSSSGIFEDKSALIVVGVILAVILFAIFM